MSGQRDLRGDQRRGRLGLRVGFFGALVWSILTASAVAAEKNGSLADRRITLPSWDQLRSVLLLEDYNTRVVIFGVALLGAAAGLVGSFTLLRKRALLGDALAHASLPGITIAFILGATFGENGKSLPLLLLGATGGGLVGVGFILMLQRFTRLKQDAALGIVLSVFFGAGMAMMGVIQQMQSGSAAGLETFIYGKTASMVRSDGILIAVTALVSISGCGLLFKELKLLCFDQDFAGSRGMPVWLLDSVLMILVVLVTMVGLQAVGLILVVALLVIPAAAARFWTESMVWLAAIASLLGLVGGVVGAGASALFPRLPSGAMIVLVCAMLFTVSMFFGRKRGIIPRIRRRRRADAKIARQHLLRGIYERLEAKEFTVSGKRSRRVVAFDDLLSMRSWSPVQLRRQIRLAQEDELLRPSGTGVYLTSAGYAEAARLTRQHRLWELYLINYAEIATARVDRDADAIEHVLEPEIVDELERLLAQDPVRIAVPTSPHELEPAE